jgi:hypothetical protein
MAPPPSIVKRANNIRSKNKIVLDRWNGSRVGGPVSPKTAANVNDRYGNFIMVSSDCVEPSGAILNKKYFRVKGTLKEIRLVALD